MLQTSEINTEDLIRTLRIWVEDLTSKYSPHNKDEAYFRNLAGWIACAATRIDDLTPKDASNKQFDTRIPVEGWQETMPDGSTRSVVTKYRDASSSQSDKP